MGASLLSNYTINDPGNDLSVENNYLIIDGITDSVNAYAYRDMGADFVQQTDDWTDTFETSVQVEDGGDHVLHHYNGVAGGYATNINGIGATYYGVSPFEGLYSHEYRQGESIQVAQATDAADMAVDTLYYCSFEFVSVGGTINLRVYTDAERTNQLGNTATVTLTNNFSHRYHYAYTSNSASMEADEGSMTVGNFDLELYEGDSEEEESATTRKLVVGNTVRSTVSSTIGNTA